MTNTQTQYLEALYRWSEEMMTHPTVSNKEALLKELAIFQRDLSNTLDSTQSVDPIEWKERAEGLQHFLYSGETDRQKIEWGKHRLPPLPYGYKALEPYISEEIMRLHHTKHHQSYVDGLNKAEVKLYVEKPKNSSEYKHWLREQAFHGSGHFLHTIFWYNMSPNGGGEPQGKLMQQIKKDFGSFARFKEIFTSAADSVEGVGWAVLSWEPRSHHLMIQTLEKHQLFSVADTIPLLVLDVWEHAYYLQYKTDKKSYINNWWNIVNWANVSHRFETASQVKWAAF